MTEPSDTMHVSHLEGEHLDELVQAAQEAAKKIAGAGRVDQSFASSQPRNLLSVLDRERALGPVLLWMRYQEARKVKGWDVARPAIEELLARAKTCTGGDRVAEVAACRKACGYLIQALQYETFCAKRGDA
jgi:hypothetical protein